MTAGSFVVGLFPEEERESGEAGGGRESTSVWKSVWEDEEDVHVIL